MTTIKLCLMCHCKVVIIKFFTFKKLLIAKFALNDNSMEIDDGCICIRCKIRPLGIVLRNMNARTVKVSEHHRIYCSSLQEGNLICIVNHCSH